MLARQMRLAVQMFLQSQNLDDSKAIEFADIYPEWEPGKNYKIEDNTILKYGKNADGETQLYRVIQDHTSQADWTPDTVTSLYKAVGFTGSGIPVWTQPLGATDAYMSGDKVSHNEKIWVSNCDNNVWEPGVYGWDAET